MDPRELLSTDAEPPGPVTEPRAPTPEELRAAPFLWDWAIIRVTLVRLVGTVRGHPDGPTSGSTGIVTSELRDVDPGLTWARTESRYYRLGKPQDPAEFATTLASKWRRDREARAEWVEDSKAKAS